MGSHRPLHPSRGRERRAAGRPGQCMTRDWLRNGLTALTYKSQSVTDCSLVCRGLCGTGGSPQKTAEAAKCFVVSQKFLGTTSRARRSRPRRGSVPGHQVRFNGSEPPDCQSNHAIKHFIPRQLRQRHCLANSRLLAPPIGGPNEGHSSAAQPTRGSSSADGWLWEQRHEEAHVSASCSSISSNGMAIDGV